MFVVMHLFAGCRREGDLEDWLARLAEEAELKWLILFIDLADGPARDLSELQTFMRLCGLVSENLIDAVFGGPPCATWSRLAFEPEDLGLFACAGRYGVVRTFARPRLHVSVKAMGGC